MGDVCRAAAPTAGCTTGRVRARCLRHNRSPHLPSGPCRPQLRQSHNRSPRLPRGPCRRAYRLRHRSPRRRPGPRRRRVLPRSWQDLPARRRSGRPIRPGSRLPIPARRCRHSRAPLSDSRRRQDLAQDPGCRRNRSRRDRGCSRLHEHERQVGQHLAYSVQFQLLVERPGHGRHAAAFFAAGHGPNSLTRPTVLPRAPTPWITHSRGRAMARGCFRGRPTRARFAVDRAAEPPSDPHPEDPRCQRQDSGGRLLYLDTLDRVQYSSAAMPTGPVEGSDDR